MIGRPQIIPHDMALSAHAVQRFGRKVGSLHLVSDLLRSVGRANMASAFGHLCRLAGIFQRAEEQCVFRLGTFNSQKWQERFQTGGSAHVGALPVMQVPSFFGGRPCYAKSSAKQRVQQGNGVRLNLLDADPFGVHGRGGILPDPHSVSASLDADVSIRVDNSSKISTFREGWHASHYTPKGGL